MVGDGLADAVGLDGEVDRAGTAGRQQGARGLADAAPRVHAGRRVVRARAYVTSHGLYELHLNGQRVGDQLFTPGWTSYNKRLQYQTYDVTPLLEARGRTSSAPCSAAAGIAATSASRASAIYYGNTLGAPRADRRHATRTGERVTIGTRRDVEGRHRSDPDVGDLPRRDLRRAAGAGPGWAAPGFDDSRWTPVRGRAGPQGSTSSRRPARRCARIEEVKPSQDPEDARQATRSSTWARTWSAGCA